MPNASAGDKKVDIGRICAIISFEVITDNFFKKLLSNFGGIIMVFEAVAKVIAERTDCAVEDVKLEQTFKELSIDSLDTVELLMNLEDALNIEIELTQKVETVGDLVTFIEENCMG